MPGPGFGGGITSYSWSCGKCGASLGTTMSPINPISNCPRCGVHFTGTNITSGPGAGMPSPGTSSPPPFVPPSTPSPPPAPTLPTNPAIGGNPILPSAPTAEPSTPAPTYSPAPVTTDNSSNSSDGRSKTLKVIGIVVGGILLIGALAVLGIVVANANSSAATPVKRKKRVLDTDSWE
ncbi:hypothetical protein J8F10_07175 [Gemmata sp. G18]|uniref:Uncharacterized protein n=1 Tax=Gemmata palustris TaxID=2822762 RepID=A0ABS5BMX3_9BACT|nr:hypothetical protein [Gemmata palustris]MBP3955060.1 hypothetical protein [Gemmata palustris]